MNHIKTIIFILLGTVLFSCGSARKVPASVDAAMTSKQLIDLHKNSEARFSTLASRVHVSYDDGNRSQSMTVNLRMKKDEAIWVSATILGIGARLLITPDKVSYYETINRTYFDGDFSLLSNWLAVDIDFEMAQNILLGNAVFPLDDKNYTPSFSGANYRLTPKQQQDILKHIFLLNPANFRMASQQLVQPYEQRVLTIDYASYQEVSNRIFPKEIRINAIEQQEQTRIILDYRSIDVNANVTFPFRIPDGYDEIRLD